jgi:three-Cys-motif partner protein
VADSHSTRFTDDGFGVTSAEPWQKQKIQIIQEYLVAFVSNLADSVDEVVFVDLFSGGGLYSIGGKGEIFAGTPLMALAQDLPIKRFVFCERDVEQFKALKIRINTYYKEKNVILLNGKPEELIDKLKLYVPNSKGDFKVAIFCVCDPFSLDVTFESIERLSTMGFNLLVPFTFALNRHLNFKYYLKDDTEKMKKYLGGYKDMDRLGNGIDNNFQFYKRLTEIYESNLRATGFRATTSSHKLDSGLMEIPTYTIGFFSKKFSANTIKQDVESTRNVQFGLFN